MSDYRAERWVRMDGFPDYEISDCGRYRRATPAKGTRAGKILKPGRTSRGGEYRAAKMRHDMKNVERLIHVLVLEHFGPPRPSPEHEVNHKDCDKTNNHIDNLEWVTRNRNMRLAYRDGLKKPPRVKLSRSKAAEIRRLTKRGATRRELAERYGVSPVTVGDVLNGNTWAVPPKEPTDGDTRKG